MITQVPTLTRVDLQDANVSDDGIADLLRLKDLTYLRLKETAISRAIPGAEIIDKGRAVFIAGESDI